MQSPVWGNKNFDVTQGHGVNLPNVPDSWYAYAAEWGLPYGHHPGLDIGMPCGTPIYAIAAGRVKFAGFSDSFRPYPVHIVTPDRRYEHIYGHLQQALVQTGQTVQAGQLLGYSGQQTIKGTTTPDGSGCHLHFELRDLQTMQALDPTALLTGSDVIPQGPGAEPWPTAEAINRRIEKSEQANGTVSKLRGKGNVILGYAKQYGIHPGVVVAIMQRENQLGAAPNDMILPFNNFGGNTCGAVGVTRAVGCTFAVDREWDVYPSVDAGIEAVFQTLNDPLYRESGGTFEDIMHIYSPPFENDWGAMWQIFAEVGNDLGITLSRTTPVYGVGSSVSGLINGEWIEPLLDFMEDTGKRAALGIGGLVVLAIGALALLGPERLTSLTPIGRAASVARKATT